MEKTLKTMWVVALVLLTSACATIEPAQNTLTILVSLDGTHPDRIRELEKGTIRDFMTGGVVAKALRPVFPTKTFPNHYSQVTGLYPYAHGIVGNQMYDTRSEKRFDITDATAKQDSSWWLGEPIWVTGARQNVKVATMFWPGSEAEIKGFRPVYWRAFSQSFSARARVNQVLSWLDQEPDLRLVTLYFEATDIAGHNYGPQSDEFYAALRQVDTLLGELVSGLVARDRLDETNFVLVSDHGMASTPKDQLVCLDDWIDPNQAVWSGKSPVLMMWPKSADLIQKLDGASANFAVYGAQDFPSHWRLETGDRVAPYIVVANEGWTVTSNCREKQPFINRATHGFDNQLPSMQGLFVAAGPDFLANTQMGVVDAVDIYSLLCHLLGIKPAPHQGDFSVFKHVLTN